MTRAPRFCGQCAAELVLKVPELDSRERLVCPRCGHVHYLQPFVAAGSIPEQDGKIVLIRRGVDPRKGYWSFPCGFMEIDEDVQSTALRETREETGLQIEITGHLGTYSYANSLDGRSIVIVAYRSRIVGGSLQPGDDVTEARWVPVQEIPWEELAFQSSHEALRDWMRVSARA